MAHNQKMPRNRSTNFTSGEKTVLFNIVSSYKDVLENKKTDSVTNHEKVYTWEKVARDFNSLSPGGVHRPMEVLKRFYENKKKELRKKCADIKTHARGTGGGPPITEMHPNEDLLLSIVNEKTVRGLDAPFGGDVDSDLEERDERNTILNDIEFIYDCPIYDVEAKFEEDPEPSGQYSNTIGIFQENKKKTWASYTPADLTKKISAPLKNKLSSQTTQSENILGPSRTINKEQKNSSRRRPATVIKALTSSHLAEKYDKLMDYRLEIAEATKKNITEEHEKKMELLGLQIEIEKENLKRMRGSDY